MTLFDIFWARILTKSSLSRRQGFQPLEKSWKPGKWKKNFSRLGKIMEFGKSPKNLEKSWNLEKINREKSWNFGSDLKLCESNFSCAPFQVSIYIPLYILLLYNDCYQIHFYLVTNGHGHGLMWCFTIFSYSYLCGTCTMEKLKFFWKKHGIRFRNSAGNPAWGEHPPLFYDL